MFLILFVLHDPDKLVDILNSWDKTGVSGITVIPSTGMGRLKTTDLLRDDLPLIPSLNDLLEISGTSNRTLITIVKGQEMVDKLVKATEEITGDLDNPDTGILAVLPLANVYGLNRRARENPDG